MNPIVTPILAELGSIEKIVITVLAVSGGFLIGAIGTHLIIAGVAKFVLKKQSSEKLTRFLRFAGGIGAAILVYILLSGDGGLGLGGKGGGEASNKKEGKNSEQPTAKQDAKTQPTTDRKGEHGILEETVTVYVLRSDSTESQFYRFENESQSLTLADVLKRIDGLIRKGPKPFVIIRPDGPEYAYQAATLLELKLSDSGIDAWFRKTKTDAPMKN